MAGKKKADPASEIKRKLVGMDLVCSGTLYSRLKPCGRPNCRCASGREEDLHGPYYEWNRRIDGRLVHKIVSAEQAKLLSRGIANRRQIDALLKDWERITAEAVLGKSKQKT